MNISQHQRKIGITGGIATGKTTVCDYLHDRYGIPVLDADLYAREAVAPQGKILPRIFQRYGDRLKTPTGTLDRQALGEIIFQDPQEKRWLECQIHPEVRRHFLQGLRLLPPQGTVVLAIPLLFEAQMTDLVTEIWVVACDPDQQRQRLQHRNGLTFSQAITRIQAQMPLAEKIKRAHCVIHNGGTIAALHRQVDACFATLPHP